VRIAIFDCNNLAFKSWSVMKETRGGLLKTSMGIPTTVIFGLLRSFNAIAEKSKGESFGRIVCCWDTSGSYYRKKIYPLYKSHRKYVDMKDYFEELDSARIYLKRFGINQIIAKGIEADDVIGYVAHSLAKLGHEVTVVSDDKDFLQLCRKNVKIFRPVKLEYITSSFVKQEFGMKPRLIPRIKALTGEDTDFIPGICDVDEKNKKLIKVGFGEKAAMKLLENGRTLDQAIDSCDNERWKERLIQKREMVHISYLLARIRTKLKWYEDWEKEILKDVIEKCLKQKIVKSKKIIRIANSLELKSIHVPTILRRLGVKIEGHVPIQGGIRT